MLLATLLNSFDSEHQKRLLTVTEFMFSTSPLTLVDDDYDFDDFDDDEELDDDEDDDMMTTLMTKMTKLMMTTTTMNSTTTTSMMTISKFTPTCG